jgi:hypothetical protein
VWQPEETSIGVSLGKGYGEEEEARERVKPVIQHQNPMTRDCVSVSFGSWNQRLESALRTPTMFLHPSEVLVHANRQ